MNKARTAAALGNLSSSAASADLWHFQRACGSDHRVRPAGYAHVVCRWVACFSVFQKAETFLPWAIPRFGRFQSPEHSR